MKQYKIFLCEPVHPEAYRLLESRAEIIADPAHLGEADAAINRNLRMDGVWMDRCPRLKVIGIHGTGTDDVDLQAARERGIRVVNTPGANGRSVAELIAGLTLSLARRLPMLDREIRSGGVCTVGGDLPGVELHGKVFGTIGCGQIGTEAAKILREGFGMRTLGYAPSQTEERAAEKGLEYCGGLIQLVRQADVVSVSVPLTEQTQGLIDASVFAEMKAGSMFINTSRGAVVDEAALYTALKAGKPAAAACDVFCSEPPTKENPLVTLPNFLATPHIGANTEDALRRVGVRTAEQVLALLDGAEDVQSI